MKVKGLLFLLLLLVSITVRLIVYFTLPEGVFVQWFLNTGLLYDVIFSAISISVLELLGERKWIVGVAWITMIDIIVKGVLGVIQDKLPLFSDQQYELYFNLLNIPPLIFYVCVFFVRKSPARIYFRCMSLVVLVPIMYLLCTLIFKLPEPGPWVNSQGAIALHTTLLNILLAVIVLKTPQLRRMQYLDFMD